MYVNGLVLTRVNIEDEKYFRPFDEGRVCPQLPGPGNSRLSGLVPLL